MKKTVLLSILFALLCFCGTARATETTETDPPLFDGYLRDHAKGVALTCWYQDGNAAGDVQSAVCAVYDSRGQLLSVAPLDPRREAQTVVIPCQTTEVHHAKLMTMDAARKPFRHAQTLRVTAESAAAPQFLTDPVIAENTVGASGAAMCYARVTADRNCRLYWALYLRDMGHPTAARFQSDDLPGTAAHGWMALSGSQPELVKLDNLDDETEYDLFLWLTNADFTASSYMRLVNFKTIDSTAPAFLNAMTPETVKEYSVTLQFTLNEDATIYWVVVEDGARFPNPPTGGGAITKEYAIRQVVSGNGGMDHGSKNASANTSTSVTLNKLTPERLYHVWYVAKDKAGNYSAFNHEAPQGVCMLNVQTLDKQPPSVTVETTSYPDGHPETPYADTGVRLVFSEGIRRFSTGEVFSQLYSAVQNARNDNTRNAAKEKLAACLRGTILLQAVSGNLYETVSERGKGDGEWGIDYRNAVVSAESEKVVVYFPTTDDTNGDSALHLLGGKTYCFQLQDISDLSDNLNQMKTQKTTTFTTMPAQILLEEITLNASSYPPGLSEADFTFSATPMAVSRADSATAWDLLFWSDTTCVFELYVRSHPASSSVYDKAWAKVQAPNGTGGRGTVMRPANPTGMSGQSMHVNLCGYAGGAIPSLRSLEDGRVYEYAVHFLELEGDTERKLWDSDTQFGVTAVAAPPSNLLNLAARLTPDNLEAMTENQTVKNIGSPTPFLMSRLFYATAAPAFTNGAPSFTPGNTSVSMWLQMTRPGTIHYLVTPAEGTISAQDLNNRPVTWSRYTEIPESGENAHLTPFSVLNPSQYNIIQQRFSGKGVKTGAVEVDSKGTTVNVTGLTSETPYFIYFVLQGTSEIYSTYAQLFRFTTLEAAPPVVRLTLNNPVTELSVNQDAVVDYVIVDTDQSMLDPVVNAVFWSNTPSGGKAAQSSYMQVNNVLEAMKMDTGNGSVFDVYATKEYKEKVAAYIRQSLSNGVSIIGIGKGMRLSSATPLTIDSSLLPMQEGHKYALISVTQSVDGGPNVFRAAYPITPPDRNPPLITNITQNLQMDGSESLELNTCSGNVTLTFDSNLYMLNGDVMKAVDLGPHYNASRSDTFTPLVDYGASNPSGQIEVSTGQVMYVNHFTSNINLTLKNAASGATITFPTQLCDDYGNVHTIALTVSLRVSTTLNGYDAAGNAVYIHKPEISVSRSWDGRTTE